MPYTNDSPGACFLQFKDKIINYNYYIKDYVNWTTVCLDTTYNNCKSNLFNTKFQKGNFLKNKTCDAVQKDWGADIKIVPMSW